MGSPCQARLVLVSAIMSAESSKLVANISMNCVEDLALQVNAYLPSLCLLTEIKVVIPEHRECINRAGRTL